MSPPRAPGTADASYSATSIRSSSILIRDSAAIASDSLAKIHMCGPDHTRFIGLENSSVWTSASSTIAFSSGKIEHGLILRTRAAIRILKSRAWLLFK